MIKQSNSNRPIILLLLSIFVGGPLIAFLIVILTEPKHQQSTPPIPIYRPSATIQTPTSSNNNTTNNAALSKDNTVATYSFEGMIGKPWTYYKVVGSRFQELGLDDKEFIDQSKNWDKLTLSIRDINVICKKDTAIVTIIDSTGKRDYTLIRMGKNSYLQKQLPNRLILEAHTPLICELFFVFGKDAASVSNLPWEMKK